MNLTRIFFEYRAVLLKPSRGSIRLHCVWLLLVLSACGPKKPVIPNDVEPIARSCYETLVTPERTPKLMPSAPMEDGTFLILWSMTEFPDERGSCTVDGSGTVLLLTSNANETGASEMDTNEPDTNEPDTNETPTADIEQPTEQPAAGQTPE